MGGFALKLVCSLVMQELGRICGDGRQGKTDIIVRGTSSTTSNPPLPFLSPFFRVPNIAVLYYAVGIPADESRKVGVGSAEAWAALGSLEGRGRGSCELAATSGNLRTFGSGVVVRCGKAGGPCTHLGTNREARHLIRVAGSRAQTGLELSIEQSGVMFFLLVESVGEVSAVTWLSVRSLSEVMTVGINARSESQTRVVEQQRKISWG